MSDKTSDKRLLPCPFCGGEAKIINKTEGSFINRYVECKNCRGRGASTKYAMTNKKIIEAWNTRKPMERIVERLEEMTAKPTELQYDVPLINYIIQIVKEGVSD